MESLGAYLKSERRARGVTLEEVSEETKVPLGSLSLIEDDRLDDLPGEVFVRGFLRAYARCVGLEPEEVVGRLDRPVPRPSMPLAPASDKDLRRRRTATPALLLVLLLASLLAALVLWRPSGPPFSANRPPPPTQTLGTAG